MYFIVLYILLIAISSSILHSSDSTSSLFAIYAGMYDKKNAEIPATNNGINGGNTFKNGYIFCIFSGSDVSIT